MNINIKVIRTYEDNLGAGIADWEWQKDQDIFIVLSAKENVKR